MNLGYLVGCRAESIHLGYQVINSFQILPVVLIPGMETRSIELQPFRNDATQHAWLQPLETERSRPAFEIPQSAFLANHLNIEGIKQHPEDGRRHRQGERAMEVCLKSLANHLRVHIECHGFVFGFLKRMPLPDCRITWMSIFQQLWVTQQRVGENCCQVFQRNRNRKLYAMGQNPLQEAQEPSDLAFHLLDWKPCFRHRIVVLIMLTAMHRFLANE